MSKTVQISSPAQLSDLVKSSTIVVADFYADWCGPCKQIGPIFEQLSLKLSQPNRIAFAKVDTEGQQLIASQYQVTALPTFIVFKEGKVAERITGADGQKLQRVVRELTQMASSAGASSGTAWRLGELPKGYKDVTDQVDIKGLDLLNADPEFGTARVLFDSSEPTAVKHGATYGGDLKVKDWVESDTDEQLMLFIPFQSTLKIHTIQLTSLPKMDGPEILAAEPKTIRIYTNRSHVLGFDEAEDIPPTQSIELAAKDWDATGTATIPLRFVKFQNVSSLVLFIVDVDQNAGDVERARLDRIRIIGDTGEKRDPGKLEKISHDE